MIDLMVILFCSAFIFSGVSMCLKGIQNIKTAIETNQWEQTVGMITRSEIFEDSDGDGVLYDPLIEYTYTVHGIEYTGKSIYIGEGMRTNIRSYAKRFVSKYPVNQQVSVYYNPTRPQFSVLESGVSKLTFSELTFGIGFAFIGIFLYINFLKDSLHSFTSFHFDFFFFFACMFIWFIIVFGLIIIP